MPKARRKEREAPEVEIDPSERDFVMARLGSARASAQAAIDAIDEVLNLFNNPDEDKKGKERTELVTDALEAIGASTRALEMAESTMDQVDFLECEPWDEDGEPEEEEEDDEDEEEDDEEEDDH